MGVAAGVRSTVIDPGDDQDPVAITAPAPERTLAVAPTVTDSPVTTVSPTSTEPPAPTATAAVEAYLQAILEERFADAYAALCNQAKASVDEASFVAELDRQRKRMPLRAFRIDDIFGATETGAIIDVTVDYGGNGVLEVHVSRAAPTAPWQICVINGPIAEWLVWPEALDPDGERPGG